jgi:hypothetical protein
LVSDIFFGFVECFLTYVVCVLVGRCGGRFVYFFRLGSFDSVGFNSRSMLLLLSCFLASSINQDRFGVSPLLCFAFFLFSSRSVRYGN